MKGICGGEKEEGNLSNIKYEILNINYQISDIKY